MTKLQRLRAREDKLRMARNKAYKTHRKLETAWNKAVKAVADWQAELHKKQVAAAQRKLEATVGKMPWYKWTSADGSGVYQFSYRYELPTERKPGAWDKILNAPSMCAWGFHVVKNPFKWARNNLGNYAPDYHLYRAEVAGQARHDNEKSAFQRMRLLYEVKLGSAEWKRLQKLGNRS